MGTKRIDIASLPPIDWVTIRQETRKEWIVLYRVTAGNVTTVTDERNMVEVCARVCGQRIAIQLSRDADANEMTILSMRLRKAYLDMVVMVRKTLDGVCREMGDR